jgi:GNAT superfamily N-acetyltransferase
MALSTIRRATVRDITSLAGLVEEYWRFEEMAGFEPAAVESQLKRLLRSQSLGAAWIATGSPEAAGYLLLVYVFSLEHYGLTAEIDEFYVRPGARGAGIGGMLLSRAEAEAAALGCTNISLQLGRDNDAGRAFYTRHGYAPRSAFELLEKTLPMSDPG